MKAKYIIVDDRGLDLAIIFNPILNHSDFKVMAEGIGTITSAGFCHILIGSDLEPTVRCYGDSVTLKLSSRPERDAQAIKTGFRT